MLVFGEIVSGDNLKSCEEGRDNFSVVNFKGQKWFSGPFYR